ncbi:MAG TPA: diguanylate cyclase, partial [Gemmatimonadaceae bacterium]|nr:diguanylate cyclase [Gemmatimonadaceae bacterium]
RQGRNADTLRALNRAHKLFDGLRARRELADIGRRVGRIEDEFVEVARRWSESIEEKDRYTQGHCKRVADLSCLIAAAAGLDQQSLFWFRIGALLHDVGKLVIPTEVLNKPGRLTADEWKLVRSHPSAGVEMLSGVDFPWDVRPIVESHHERWDGAGYPHGLAGQDIPLTARILCVADVYDALTSERSYKQAMSHQQAMDVMRQDVGHVFDPELFPLFEAIAGEFAERKPAAASRTTTSSAATTPAAALAGDPASDVPAAADAAMEALQVLQALTRGDGASAKFNGGLGATAGTAGSSASADARGPALGDVPRTLTPGVPLAPPRFGDAGTDAAPDAAAPGLHPTPAVAGAAVRTLERDDLTGLLTRRSFIDRATVVLADRAPDAPPASLLVIDVDHFKLVNDTYGHLQGDDVLRAVAGVFSEQLRGADAVGRYAGDEFVVLLPEATAEVAYEVAERLRAAVQRTHCPVRDRPAGSGAVAVTLSIGVATAPRHGEQFETLFAAADRALYDAKRRGRNAVGVSEGNTAEEAEAPRPDFERFVGRTAQLRRLVRLLEASARGQPGVVAIVGEAGVGKSTLLRQLGPEVRLRAGALVRGRCLEADVRPPYGAWADVVSALHQQGAVRSRAWRELPRIVPELGAAPDAGVEPSAANKYVLVDEIVEYLRLAAAAHPVVVVLDDMQWADAATWDTLEHLLPLVTQDRLLICLTIRAEDLTGDVAERRGRLVRDERFHEIPLERLTPADVTQWVEGVFQGQTIGRAAVDFLYEHSEGNPLLVAQLLRTLVEEGAIAYTDGRWRWRPSGELADLPVAVSEVMSRRLARLSPEARTILVSAAVVGRAFDVNLVVAAGAGAEDDVLDAIDEAVAAAVLEPLGERSGGGSTKGGDRYTFTHALLVGAVLRSANPRRVRRIHERVAQVLEAKWPGAVADIAVHYDRAESKEKAYQYAIEAGQQAARLQAHDEATAFFMMAHRHASSLKDLAEVRYKLAQVAESAGRYAEAEGLCDMAVAWLEEEKTSPLRFSARRMRERLRAAQGQPPGRTLAACWSLLAEAEEAGAESERVALLTMISQAHSRLGELAAAERIARECVALAEGADDPALLSEACMRLGTTLLETSPAEAVGYYTRALESYSEAGDRYGQARCYINTGVAHARAGDGRAAEKAYVIALELSREAHAPDLAGLAALNLGVWYLSGGRFDDAAERLEEALRLFTTVKNEHHRLGSLYNLAHVALDRGDPANARDLYQSAVELARTIGHPDVEVGALGGFGLTSLSLGDRASAQQSLDNAMRLIGEREDWWFQGRELVEALAVRLTDSDGATRLARFERAHALAERHAPYGAAWLAAECGEVLLADAHPPSTARVEELVARYSEEAERRGYVLLGRKIGKIAAARSGK